MADKGPSGLTTLQNSMIQAAERIAKPGEVVTVSQIMEAIGWFKNTSTNRARINRARINRQIDTLDGLGKWPYARAKPGQRRVKVVTTDDLTAEDRKPARRAQPGGKKAEASNANEVSSDLASDEDSGIGPYRPLASEPFGAEDNGHELMAVCSIVDEIASLGPSSRHRVLKALWQWYGRQK